MGPFCFVMRLPYLHQRLGLQALEVRLLSLKGTGFSPYIYWNKRWALAPEGNAFH
jgi:hypothetical protein